VTKSNYRQIFNNYPLDLMIGSIDDIDSNYNRHQLYTEQHICLFYQQETSIIIPISIDDYLSVPHVLANPTGQTTSFIDEQFTQQGLQRKVSITSANFLTLSHLLLGRKLLCVVPELIAKMDVFSNTLSYEVAPIKMPDFEIECCGKTQ
jgi:LysR family transcriptional activator of mexEF-oprN operon